MPCQAIDLEFCIQAYKKALMPKLESSDLKRMQLWCRLHQQLWSKKVLNRKEKPISKKRPYVGDQCQHFTLDSGGCYFNVMVGYPLQSTT